MDIVCNIFNNKLLFLRSLSHLIITLPSFIYHGLHTKIIRKFNPIKYEPTSKDILNKKKAIIFVHGRGGHYSDFNPMISHLKSILKEDIDNYSFLSIDLGDTTDSTVRKDAEELATQLKIYTEDTELILIGLSKGGNVIHTYFQMEITESCDKRNITKLITISSPLSGTKIVDLLPRRSQSRYNLAYVDSKHGVKGSIYGFWDFEEETPKYIIKRPNTKYYSIVPRFDHLIIPTESAQLNISTSFTHHTVYNYNGYYNHIALPYSYDIAEAIASFITN